MNQSRVLIVKSEINLYYKKFEKQQKEKMVPTIIFLFLVFFFIFVKAVTLVHTLLCMQLLTHMTTMFPLSTLHCASGLLAACVNMPSVVSFPYC